MKTLQLITRKIAASLVCPALLIFAGSALADNTGSGGTIVYTDSGGLNPVATPPYVGGYVVHTFTTNGTLILPSSGSADVLVVAGGGGGGGAYGDGGGAGGLVFSNLSLNAGSYVVTVGAGGNGTSANTSGANGNNSTFDTLLTALGGGGGGDGYPASVNGQNGGSGGGTGGDGGSFAGGTATQPSSSSGGYGNAGYGGDANTYGGGGGAGAAATSEAGGDGLQYAISGVNTYYAGGGAGLFNSGSGLGGQGGGGAGGNNSAGGNGTANTGGGGGGGWGATGGSGGSGIIIVRYPYLANPSLSVVVTSPDGQSLLHGFSTSATAFVAGGTGPYSVTYHYKLTTAGSYTATAAVGPFGGTNTFTQALGTLPLGAYQIYATVTDSAVGTANSVTNTFTVVNVNNFSFEQDVTGGATTTPPTGWAAFYGSQPSNFIGSQAAANAQYTSSPPLTAPGDGNQFVYINNGGGAGADGIYQDVGTLLANTTYTLTVAVGSRADWTGGNGQGTISLLNGVDQTGTVLASTTSSVAPQTGTFTDYTVTISTGGSVSGDLIIELADLGPSGFTQVNFDNVRLSCVTSPVPLPILLTNITPASATVAVGSNVVFTAAFSNSPPVSLQWQQLVSGLTNDINTGVVIATHNGVVSSTLTLNNVQLTNAGSYWLKATNATNFVTVVYSASAPLTVIPTITWHAAGTYNNSFTNDSVLALAGSSANEVYGVNFGVGLLTTANGYVFDDYQTAENLSVAGSLNTYTDYLPAGTTGDANFDFMLNNGDWGTSANTATLNNLTVGQAYTVLVLLADTRPAANGSTFYVTDGLTVSPAQQYAYANGASAIGGYIMGTFTAVTTNQSLTVLNSAGSQYQAVLLEKGLAPAPPIPPTLTADLNPLLYRVTTGGPVTLSVLAGGSVPLHYQWFNQAGPITGANSTNYFFNAVAGTNAYYAVITNSSGSVTSSTAVVISSTNIVTVNNFSFEQDVTGDATTTAPTGWSAFYGGEPDNFIGSQAAANAQYTSSPPLTAPGDGNQFMYINNNGSGVGTDGVYQDVGVLLANTTYTLTVAVGSRADWTPGPNGQGTISLLNGVDQTGTLLASTTSNIGSQAGTFTDVTATFTTSDSVSGDLIVDLTVAGTPSVFTQGNFDNVRLTQTAVTPLILPIPGKPSISGGNLILTGTGGTANSTYTWLQTTNLSAPVNWTTNFAGTLDGAGAYSNAIPINASQNPVFFRLRLP